MSDSRHTALWDLGIEHYDRAYQSQIGLHRLRQSGEIADTLMMVEHRPCVTLGRSFRCQHLLLEPEELRARDIAVYETDRGGDITYHGPGQLVLYAIIDLGEYGRDVHAHARRLEQVLIDVVGSFGIAARRIRGYPGVWTAGGKVGALGLAVKRWVTMHGASLNVSCDMSGFSTIVPCGIADRSVTSLAQLLGHDVDMAAVKARVKTAFEHVFAATLVEIEEGLRQTVSPPAETSDIADRSL